MLTGKLFAPSRSLLRRTLVATFVCLLATSLGTLSSGCDEQAGGSVGDPCKKNSDCKAGLECDQELGTCISAEDFRIAPDVSEDTSSGEDTFEDDADGSADGTMDGEVSDATDAEVTCVDGEERQCGADIGECTLGTQVCVDGVWGECSGEQPTEEVCDGLDNDCDGQVDGSDGVLLSRTCGESTGACQQGTQSCGNGEWGPCKDERGPAPEVCDGRDNDCNGEVDDMAQDAKTWFADEDGDGFGNVQNTLEACEQPTGYVADNTDCDDTSVNAADINPDATEVCDTVDNDCDGFVDEAEASPPTWYADRDGDGFGDVDTTSVSCEQPTGFVADDTDCDDTSPNAADVNPDATEVCDTIDNNCNGFVDEGMAAPKTWYADTDGDNYGDPNVTTVACSAPPSYVADKTDCDDTGPNAADINPMATEVCDGVDNDCDTFVDEGMAAPPTWYADKDGDTYGDVNDTTDACTQPAGYVADSSDCDDDPSTGADINPGATEVCDGVDNNCNTLVDEGVKTTYYADADGDSYGDADVTQLGCSPPAGFVADDTDCDDDPATGANINPGEPEVCDGADNNCNTLVDEGVKNTYYADTDGDNFGDPNSTTQACTPPAGYVIDNTDCDDGDGNNYPTNTEVCDTQDNDCDGNIDENVQNTYYADSDGDNYGNPNIVALGCTPPANHVADNTDCNDGRADVNPGATEVCDEVDNDCDTLIDENVLTTFYRDQDGDNYGDPNVTTDACTAPMGYVSDNTDCDDTSGVAASVNPGATEVCNLIDDDCDTLIDENVKTTFYRDADGDFHGVPTDTTDACTAPAGYVALDDDCDDGDDTIFPGANELCDNKDNDCNNLIDDGVQNFTFYHDNDSDGYGDPNDTLVDCAQPAGYVQNPDDCDDDAGAVNPGATEVCNTIDDDCDTLIDENVENTYYADTDGDTYGDPNNTTQACSPPAGYVTNNDDCDDTGANAADINPDATEVCDLVDNDCDSQIDEGVKSTFYADSDGDNYGDSTQTTQACTAPAGYVADDTDCNDSLANVNPGETEVCDTLDNDCDGLVDENVTTTYYRDADSDNYGNPSNTTEACSTPPAGYVANPDDCNDSDGAINPAATEVCDEVDNDCDGLVDENVTTTFYRDRDRDNYGTTASTTEACSAPNGFVANPDDCDDNDDTINPSATEVCDLVDNDCDGDIDEDVKTTFYRDADGDNYGNPSVTTDACSQPNGFVSNPDDCNDSNGAINPAATEVCDLVDNDCDGDIDEGVENTYYLDNDDDGFGNASITTMACSPPAGYVADNTDCDDSDPNNYPTNSEVCDGADNDCDTQIDEGVQTTFYADTDDDGYGDPFSTRDACSVPNGYVANDNDCNDSRADIYPGAPEICDGADNDCDGNVDEGVQTTFYADTDGDGYGDPSNTTLACTVPAGHVSNADDCNDSQAQDYPGAPEVCDGRDNDCDGTVDEGVKNTYYRDRDSDGYGISSDTRQSCVAPAGYASVSGDCDDNRDTVFPGATELCDGLDNDCDGDVDEGCPQCDMSVDNDFDGSNECDDCDDTNGAVYPGAPELCDGLDNDCDLLIDEDFDMDGDTYATCGNDPTLQDCDDSDPNVNPGMNELCGNDGTGNGIDDNCNGYVDEGCDPCDPVDQDGDGVSECDGDCEPNDGSIYPGNTEVCDGLDNDCNIFTVQNCDVSETCNYASGADVCFDDLLCACLVDGSGSCSGDYQCTSFCNNSETGPVGDGCASDQTCSLELLRSSDLRGCNVDPDPVGTKLGGESCSGDSECRSGDCDRICVGGPGCNSTFCIDACSNDSYCASTAVCRIRGTSSDFDGTCEDVSFSPFLGSNAVGDSCSSDGDCDHGYCSDRFSECTSPCCKDSDCPSGFTCGFDVDTADTSYIVVDEDSAPCSSDSDCPGDMLCYGTENKCAWRLVETMPMCVRDVSGQGTRQAGAACSQNSDCRSNFCDTNLSVCVEHCCNDTTCPVGLTCELQTVETVDDKVTNARVCLNVSTDEVLLRK